MHMQGQDCHLSPKKGYTLRSTILAGAIATCRVKVNVWQIETAQNTGVVSMSLCVHGPALAKQRIEKCYRLI